MAALVAVVALVAQAAKEVSLMLTGATLKARMASNQAVRVNWSSTTEMVTPAHLAVIAGIGIPIHQTFRRSQAHSRP